jgi:cell division protein FtsB
MKRLGLWWIAGLLGLIVLLVILFVSLGEYNDLESQLEASESELEASKSENTSLGSQLTQVQSSLSDLQTDLSQLQEEYDAVNQELEELINRPTASNFDSVNDLEAWLLANTLSNEPWASTFDGWYDKALRLQQAAADDGYIISVQYHFCDEQQVLEYIACTAYISGFLWIWDPETDDVYPDPIWGVGAY